MDETPLFADNMGKTTLASKGAKEVKMTTTGNGKKFQTLVLSINLDGSKNKPCIIFKGKGRVSEAQELQNRDVSGAVAPKVFCKFVIRCIE